MKISSLITVILLVLAVFVEVFIDQKTLNQLVAEKYIGQCESINFSVADAFQSKNKTVFLFTCSGFQGPIKAMVVLSNNELEKITILKSSEGLDKSVLDNSSFLASFEKKNIDEPINADIISGATVSSQILIDQVNQIIKEWNKRNDGH